MMNMVGILDTGIVYGYNVALRYTSKIAINFPGISQYPFYLIMEIGQTRERPGVKTYQIKGISRPVSKHRQTQNRW